MHHDNIHSSTYTLDVGGGRSPNEFLLPQLDGGITEMLKNPSISTGSDFIVLIHCVIAIAVAELPPRDNDLMQGRHPQPAGCIRLLLEVVVVGSDLLYRPQEEGFATSESLSESTTVEPWPLHKVVIVEPFVELAEASLNVGAPAWTRATAFLAKQSPPLVGVHHRSTHRQCGRRLQNPVLLQGERDHRSNRRHHPGIIIATAAVVAGGIHRHNC